MPENKDLVEKILFHSLQKDEMWERKITRWRKKGDDVPQVPDDERYKGSSYFSSHKRTSTCTYKGYDLHVVELVDLFRFPEDGDSKKSIRAESITATVKKGETVLKTINGTDVEDLLYSLTK
jgi:hypothetical protein